MTFICYLWKAAWKFLLLKSYHKLFCSNNVWDKHLKNGQELRKYKGVPTGTSQSDLRSGYLPSCRGPAAFLFPPTTYLQQHYTLQDNVLQVLLFKRHLHNTTRSRNTAPQPKSPMLLHIKGNSQPNEILHDDEGNSLYGSNFHKTLRCTPYFYMLSCLGGRH